MTKTYFQQPSRLFEIYRKLSKSTSGVKLRQCRSQARIKKEEGCSAGQPPANVKKILVTETSIQQAAFLSDAAEDSLGQTPGQMNAFGESRKEATSMMCPLLKPQEQMKVGFWNVRTMNAPGKTAQVIREMKNYKLDILGVSECRWPGNGKTITRNGAVILHSGRADGHHSRGVALILSSKCKKSLIEWKPVNERIITARFASRHIKLSIIQCYAPTNEAEEEEKEEYLRMLQEETENIPRHDMLIVIGDQNAKVGAQNEGHERTLGKKGLGERNENGQHFIDYCEANNLVIGGTIFQHKDIHLATWRNPAGTGSNQIDHLAINGKFRRSLEDVCVKRGADVGSDHHLVVANIRLKLRVIKEPRTNKINYAVDKLKETNVKNKFSMRLRKEMKENCQETGTVEERWKKVTEAYTRVSEEVLGRRERNKPEWLSEDTWKKVESRKESKKQLLQAKSERLKEKCSKQYKERDKEVKKATKRDKRKYLEDLSHEAQTAADRGEIGRVYQITKQICGNKKREHTMVKDKEGRYITDEEGKAKRWAEHFKEVLNRPEPEDTIDEDTTEDIGIDTEPISRVEIRRAIAKLKNRKATGVDNLNAELFKADVGAAVEILYPLFAEIWEQEDIPEDWSKGIICKIPKKGDNSVCDNWRGVTLLSIPSKVFCRVIIDRISTAVDERLRKEQAGFRKGRGCANQIFILKNIIEQSMEWNAPLYVNFIDFQKAFDSVHRDSLWKILKSYGIPASLVRKIEMFYNKLQCAVLVNGKTTEWFKVTSGVRQGCVMSGFLFIIAIDWVTRKATTGIRNGIQWGPFNQLEDLDYADDIALLSHTKAQMQRKTDRLTRAAEKIGLKVNRKKTKVLAMNQNVTGPITLEEQDLEEVEQFCYLGATIHKKNIASVEIRNRMQKARVAYHKLNKIWKAKEYKTKTKINLYKSNVRSVLLYGAECWKVNKADGRKLEAFQNRILRRIKKVFWPNMIKNSDLLRDTNVNPLSEEIKKRRWRFTGHVLRMEPNTNERIALKWKPTGKRNVGRPKETWRRMMEKERQTEGWSSWNEAAKAASDRLAWRCRIEALCVNK